MSPYERQIDPLDAVDVNYVLGVPGQASPEEPMEPLLSSPLSAQRLGSHDAASEVLPTATELLAAAGIEVGGPIPGQRFDGLGYDPSLGYDTGSYLRAQRDTEITASLGGADNHAALSSGGGRLRLRAAAAGLAVLAVVGAAIALTANAGSDGDADGQVARANGAATTAVLAQDLDVVMGTYARGGLPVTLTNTADRPLAYNVSIEALDAAGHRVTADAVFVGSLAAGTSIAVTMFATAGGDSSAELVGAQFHIVEASSY